MRGRFVTFEGIDGCGKSTVAKLICRRLRKEGIDCILTCEPTKSWLGAAVRKGWEKRVGIYAEAFLFLADRAEHIVWIKGQMSKGKLVLCDRYLDSTIAYQGAGLGECGKDTGHLSYLRNIHGPFLLLPDRTIYLRLAPETAISRVKKRGSLTKFERIDFLRKVSANYDYLAAREPRRFAAVDASLELGEVVERSLALLRKKKM